MKIPYSLIQSPSAPPLSPPVVGKRTAAKRFLIREVCLTSSVLGCTTTSLWTFSRKSELETCVPVYSGWKLASKMIPDELANLKELISCWIVRVLLNFAVFFLISVYNVVLNWHWSKVNKRESSIAWGAEVSNHTPETLSGHRQWIAQIRQTYRLSHFSEILFIDSDFWVHSFG